jgi:hypothetical protein
MKSFLYFLPFIFGVLFSFSGVKNLLQAYDSRNWSICEGMVTRSEVVKQTVHGGKRSTTRTLYIPKVQYEYAVDGNAYSSGNISIGARSAGREDAQQTVNYYNVGKRVEVYFNPEVPSESALELGVRFGTYLPLLIGLFFVVAGLFVIKALTATQKEAIL